MKDRDSFASGRWSTLRGLHALSWEP